MVSLAITVTVTHAWYHLYLWRADFGVPAVTITPASLFGRGGRDLLGSRHQATVWVGARTTGLTLLRLPPPSHLF